MKQSFSGEFFFLGKQKRESRDINERVWILKFWKGWKTDRSLSQKWLLGHSLMENNDALLPWAHLWLLFLSAKPLERKQQEGISVPVMQQGCLVTVTVLIRWCCELDWVTVCVQRNRKGGLMLSSISKMKILKQKTSSCSQKKLRARVPLSSRLCCALSLHSNVCARATTVLCTQLRPREASGCCSVSFPPLWTDVPHFSSAHFSYSTSGE